MQVQQSGVGNTGLRCREGRGVPSAVVVWVQKKDEIFILTWHVLAHFEQASVEIALKISL